MRADESARAALETFAQREPGEDREPTRTQVVDLITCALFLVGDPQDVIREASDHFRAEYAEWIDHEFREITGD